MLFVHSGHDRSGQAAIEAVCPPQPPCQTGDDSRPVEFTDTLRQTGFQRHTTDQRAGVIEITLQDRPCERLPGIAASGPDGPSPNFRRCAFLQLIECCGVEFCKGFDQDFDRPDLVSGWLCGIDRRFQERGGTEFYGERFPNGTGPAAEWLAGREDPQQFFLGRRSGGGAGLWQDRILTPVANAIDRTACPPSANTDIERTVRADFHIGRSKAILTGSRHK